MESRNRSLHQMMNSQRTAGQPTIGAEYGSYDGMTQAPRVETMTVDDVIVRTVGLLGLTLVGAFFTWTLASGGNVALAQSLSFVGMLVGFGVMIFSMFRPIMSPAVAVVYCVGQGFLLGFVSLIFNQIHPGIAVNAVIGTVLVFIGMLLLYKNRVVRNSPKFTKVMMGAGIGFGLLILVNFASRMMGADLGLFSQPGESGTLLQWLIVIGLVAFAAFSFVLDFDMIEQSVAQGAPKKFAWAGAFGLAAGLIFLYWTLLQLLSLFQGGD
ncbi:Bax inhibitor-1/YccA family protein [Natronoglycomyces albus]|uniref:Bax inhibitor-1/YccA family protein n=1 Tax=Natronoglycomyces albus TaxID=2811108 RepID=A0A895XRQ6_9ACTN|nr:Bax inhibitor-1/YccA family protein [Natronoglycomyces albus]QSB05865.1 Bax inhibitor-1/YccA family protein [Natronoglycomyces albus]